MPNFFCCVHGCNSATLKKKRLDKYPWMESVSFLPFPSKKHPRIRRRWIESVRRELRWVPNKYTRICSRHFVEGRILVPTLFPYNSWGQDTCLASISRTTRVAETARISMSAQSTPVQSTAAQDESVDMTDIVQCYPYVAGEMLIKTSSHHHDKGNINNITSYRTPQSSEDHSYIQTKNNVQLVEVSCQTELSMVDIKQMEDQVGCLREAGLTVDEIEKIKCENLELSDRLENKDYLMREIFIDKVTKTDTTVQNFTGFPKKSYLDGVFDILEKSDSQLNYWSGQKSNKQQAYQTDENRKKSGPQRKLTRYQEFVMTWIRLRLGLTIYVLAHLFGISQSRVSQIFITWTTFMSDVLGPLLVWPTREQVYKHMPPSFRRQYPRTRVIIDCTEFFFQKPRSPHAQSATYSTYKSKNTAKLLVAITPSGTICFISELYGGNASDRYITEHSGFLDRLEYGDDVMADRGFTIRDLVTMKHATLNIPPFTRKCNWGKGRFLSLSDIKKTRLIAKVRIHVERAIQRMKTFRLINQVIPWSLKPVMNQMVTIIAVVCNLHPKLVKR